MNTAVNNIEPRIKLIEVSEDTITAYLVDGRTISVPLAWSWRLSDAAPEERNNWELIGDGQGVGQGLAGGDRVGMVGLGNDQVGFGLKVGALGHGVVIRVGIGRITGYLSGIGEGGGDVRVDGNEVVVQIVRTTEQEETINAVGDLVAESIGALPGVTSLTLEVDDRSEAQAAPAGPHGQSPDPFAVGSNSDIYQISFLI